jgi:hypothetical protein
VSPPPLCEKQQEPLPSDEANQQAKGKYFDTLGTQEEMCRGVITGHLLFDDGQERAEA